MAIGYSACLIAGFIAVRTYRRRRSGALTGRPLRGATCRVMTERVAWLIGAVLLSQAACSRPPEAGKNNPTLTTGEASVAIVDSSCSPIHEITGSTRGLSDHGVEELVESYGDKTLVELQRRVKYWVRVDILDLDCDGTSDLTASFAAVDSLRGGVNHLFEIYVHPPTGWRRVLSISSNPSVEPLLAADLAHTGRRDVVLWQQGEAAGWPLVFRWKGDAYAPLALPATYAISGGDWGDQYYAECVDRESPKVVGGDTLLFLRALDPPRKEPQRGCAHIPTDTLVVRGDSLVLASGKRFH